MTHLESYREGKVDMQDAIVKKIRFEVQCLREANTHGQSDLLIKFAEHLILVAENTYG